MDIVERNDSKFSSVLKLLRRLELTYTATTSSFAMGTTTHQFRRIFFQSGIGGRSYVLGDAVT